MEFKVQSYQQFRNLSWDTLDKSVSVPHLKEIRRVVVFIDSQRAFDATDVNVFEELTKNLPQCFKRGILSPYTSSGKRHIVVFTHVKCFAKTLCL